MKKKAIATRSGRPAYENAPPRLRQSEIDRYRAANDDEPKHGNLFFVVAAIMAGGVLAAFLI